MDSRLFFTAVLGGAFVLILFLLLAPAWRRARLARVRAAGAPAHWDGLLRQRMSYYRAMPPEVRRRLLGQTQVFLHEKVFVGCAGLRVTEEMRVVIAAWASLMTLGAADPYPRLRSILIYPDVFVVDKEYEDEAGVVTVGRDALIGESWEQEKVVLSWADIEDDLGTSGDPTNVIVHEFAHQLDALDGEMGGSPPQQDVAAHRTWAEVFGREYERLRATHLDGDGTAGVIDPYGATEPAEFFAVAVEAFFETPEALYGEHGELYALMSRYFEIDPRAWLRGRA